MKDKTCCFTGHRSLDLTERPALTERLFRETQSLIARGVTYFGAGGALGFDTLAAQTVLCLRETNPQIRLILVLPCRDQDARWKESDRATYRELLARADKAVYVSERYDAACMHKRNRHLVDHSGHCVCYLAKTSGGSFYTVQYALRQGLSVVNLYEPPR